ncbi:MAG: 23S rRNA (uracil(1939)-C(5))-methyltransferase RlmD [Clostridia bacterium]|nr:23S rRNA (uracil(1939)-C(5))-methyltransferase RlmD [Clostridia bacterium]
MINKNDEYIVEIIDNGIDGEGIAKIDGYTLFVEGAIKGEKIKVLIVKANKTYGYGKIIELIEKSPYRVEPICPQYKKCGGCSLQHMSYEAQMRYKEEKVKKTINKFLGENNNFIFNSIIGMGIPYNYRNKAQYPCQSGKIGFYSVRSHEVIENNYCYIQDEESDKLAKKAFDILMQSNNVCYNEKDGTGNIRHIMVRIGKNSGELMLVIITKNEVLLGKEELIKKLKEEFPNLKSIIQNINDKNTNIIMGKTCKTLYGEDYIVDILGEYKFKISPLSFYQVNPVQTEILYYTAVEMAKLKGDEISFDLYCGIGTISSFLSSKCKKVYGVEIVPEAIEDAKENAKLNEITNIDFRCGAAEDIIPKMYEEDNIKANVVFVDPPRKGCDQVLLDTIIKMKPEKMIYISCNVATLGRDLKYLIDNSFELQIVQPVDQFPQTAHVETIALLRLK